MNNAHRIPLAALAASLAVLAAASLSGCSALGDSTVGHLIFENKAEATSDHNADVPAWVPDDAVNISLDYSAQGGDYLLSFGSQQGVAADGACTVDEDTSRPAPTNGWPEASRIDARMLCGTTQVVRSGTDWFAWVQR